MAIAARLLGSGIAPQAAQNIVGDYDPAITATGTSTTDAYQLFAAVSNVTTTAASTGVKLPTLSPGDAVEIFNAGANTLTIYPAGSDVFNNAASSLSLATKKAVRITKYSATQLGSVLTA